MKKVRLVFAAALALALVSCNKLAVEKPSAQEPLQEERISSADVARNLEIATKAITEDEETMDKLRLLLMEGKDGSHLYIEVAQGEACYVNGEVGIIRTDDGQTLLDLDIMIMGLFPVQGTINPYQVVKYGLLGALSMNIEEGAQNIEKANEYINIRVNDTYVIYLGVVPGEASEDFTIKLFMANPDDTESEPISLSDIVIGFIDDMLGAQE